MRTHFLILHHFLVLCVLHTTVTCFLLPDMDDYAMYVWRDGYDPYVKGCTVHDFLKWDKNSPCFTHTWNDSQKRSWLWRTCNLHGRKIKKIFLADVYHKLRTKSCDNSGIDLIKQTLKEGHTQVPGLQIYALFAASDASVSEKDMVQYVVWYNDFCAGAINEKFDGVAVNNEAYAKIKCNHGEGEQLLYLTNLNKIKTEALKQQHGQLSTHYSVGWHWGRCGSTSKNISYNGKSQNVLHHMIDIFDSVDVQVGYIIFPQISDRVKLAGYQYAIGTGKQLYVTLYTNKGDPCQTTFFPSACNKGKHTEQGMFQIFDDFNNHGIGKARPCIHYFRGIYSSGGHPDWPIR